MSAFTFTAPIVTPEQERQEREALTDQQVELLKNQVYGKEQAIPETEELVARGRAELTAALDAMPNASKADYLLALQHHAVLEREASAMAFLRTNQFNGKAAAEQMVGYWKLRKQVFANDRASLPMTLQHAMQGEREYLEKCIVLVLPDDDSGRPVIYWDRIRCTKTAAPREHAARCFWYLLQTIANRQVAQQLGFVFVINMRGCDLYKHFDRILSKSIYSIVKFMPTACKAIHHCTGSGASVMELILPVYKQMMGKDMRLRTHLHAGSNNEILDQFGDFGMRLEHVNCLFQWNGPILDAWLNEQLALEQRQQQEQEQQNGNNDTTR